MAKPRPTGYAPGGIVYKKPVPKKGPTPKGQPPVSSAPRPQPKPFDPYAGLLGTAQTQIKQITDPIIAEIQRQQQQAIDTQRQQSAANLKNIQDAYATQSPIIQGTYENAIKRSAALGDALSKALAGQGADATGALSAAVQGIAPDTGRADQLAALYKGAGVAGTSSSQSELQNLLSQQASSNNLLAQQPAWATQINARDLGNAIAQVQTQYGNQLGNLTSQIPTQAQQLYDTLYSRAQEAQKIRIQQAQAAAQIAQDNLNRLSKEKQVAMALGNKIEVAKISAEERHQAAILAANSRYDVANIGATSRQNVATTQANARRDAATIAANQRAKAAAAKAKGKGGTGENWNTPGSAKRGRVIKSITDTLWTKVPQSADPQTGNVIPAHRVKNVGGNTPVEEATNVAKEINRAMTQAGVIHLDSPAAIAVRKTFMRQWGIPDSQIGPKGYPVGGNKGGKNKGKYGK